jgi:hypothetical protein
VAGILVATAVSFAVPVHYQSQAVFTATPADESTRRLLDNLERSVISRESLAAVIEKHDLYPRERARMPLDEVIDKMQRNIRLYPLPLASPLNRDALSFAVQFDYSEPQIPQQVNEELASRFMEGMNIAPQLNSHSTLRLHEPPSLPPTAIAPNRTQFAAVGLFAGLLAGFTLVTVVRSRRSTTVGNS